MAEQVFKNIRVLKGITVDDFMETMGLMTAALQFDCSDCHAGAGTDKVDWAALAPEQRRLFLENLNEPPHLKLRVPRAARR